MVRVVNVSHGDRRDVQLAANAVAERGLEHPAVYGPGVDGGLARGNVDQVHPVLADRSPEVIQGSIGKEGHGRPPSIGLLEEDVRGLAGGYAGDEDVHLPFRRVPDTRPDKHNIARLDGMRLAVQGDGAAAR